MATIRTFDTLGYAKYLAENGFEKNQAEALAEANYGFLMNDLATKEFVHREIEKTRHEITAAEMRITQSTGKMIAVAVGVLLAGIPIIQALLARLG